MTNPWTNRVDRIIVLALVTALGIPAQAQNDALKIVVVEGRDAQHDLAARRSAATAVEVRRDGRPVEGARVRFVLPTFGPGGRFADGMRDHATFTNDGGHARMPAFAPNGIEGRFTLIVEAGYGSDTASVAVSQSNLARVHSLATVGEPTSGAGKSRASSKLLLVLGITAAVGVGAAFASRAGRSGPPTSVSIGGIGVGGGN